MKKITKIEAEKALEVMENALRDSYIYADVKGFSKHGKLVSKFINQQGE